MAHAMTTRHAALLLVMLLGRVAHAQLEVRNSLVDWNPSQSQQPVNGWSYYAYRAHDPHTPASYTPMQYFSTPNRSGWHAPADGGCSIYSTTLGILQSPSAEWEPVRAWTASATGVVQISPAERIGRPLGQAAGDGVRLQVWRNGWLAHDVEVPPDAFIDVEFTTSFPVNAGDTLYFHCTRNRAPFQDGMQFNPLILLYPGPGYATAPRTADTAASFGQPGTWTVEAFDHQAGQYTAMVPGQQSPNAMGAYLEVPGVYCRVWQTTAHPLHRYDAVWSYTAPADGQLLLESVGPVAKRWSNQNVTELEVVLRPLGSNERRKVRNVRDVDLTGRRIGASIHVRAGDRVSVHLSNGGASNINLFTSCQLAATLHPRGIPRQPVAHSGPMVVTPGQRAHYFHQHLVITGDLEVQAAGELALDDCVVELANAAELEFEYAFDGSVRTRGTVLGGNRVAAQADRILPSAIYLRGTWESRDTEVRYTYGQMLLGTANLDAEGHVSVAHGDFVHVNDFCTLSLTDSVVAVAFTLPVDQLGGDTDLNLKVDRWDTTMPQIPWQGQPQWTGTMSDTMVYMWSVKVAGLTGPADGQFVPHEIRLAETVPGRVSIRVWGATNMTGTLPLADPTTGIASGTTWQTCNSRWRTVGPGPTWLASLNADVSNGSAMRMTGPGKNSEFMAFWGSRANLTGTPGTHDAISAATRIKAHGDSSLMALDNCTLGSAWTAGEVSARQGARISIRDARIEYPLDLVANDASASKIVISNWSGGGSLNAVGRVFEVTDHYPFDDNDDEWMDWSAAGHGFVSRSVQTPHPGATATPSGQVYHLEFPAQATYGNTLATRIVAPGSRDGATWSLSGDVYLYARIRANVTTPRIVGGQPVISFQFSTRDLAVGWSSWSNYVRWMEVVADGQFHDYCWKLTDPGNSPDPILWSGTAPNGGSSLPAQADYYGLHFGASADVGSIDAGDFVELDYVVLSGSYSPLLHHW